MTATIPDLWSEEIKVDVLTPLAILRTQEGFLERRTQGTLRALVSSNESASWVRHQLDLIAPALDGYRTTLLTAKHHIDSVYPVIVRSRVFLPAHSPQQILEGDPDLLPDEKEAITQDEFIELVRKVLHSRHVLSLTQSLIARSNEMRNQGQGREAGKPNAQNESNKANGE